VPLVLKLPGNALAGTRHSSEVGLADVAPTVLGILGLGNLNGADGRNLWSAGSHRLNELSAPQSAAHFSSSTPTIRPRWSQIGAS
jgi:hypothetical protein